MVAAYYPLVVEDCIEVGDYFAVAEDCIEVAGDSSAVAGDYIVVAEAAYIAHIAEREAW